MAVKETEKKPKEFFKGKAGPGRPKGVPNKRTTLLKDAILEAANRAGKKLSTEDGKEGDLITYLANQADKNPGPFMALLGKVLPMQVVGPDDGDGNPTSIQINIVDPQR